MTELRLTWIGQSGFLFDDGRDLVGVDLYLSDHLEAKYRGTDKPHVRLRACPVTPRDLAGLRWLFRSHKHSDHLDPGSVAEVMAAAPHAELVVPAPLVEYAVDELGAPAGRVIGAVAGQRVGPFLPVPAAHPDPGPAVLSVIVESGGIRTFHSGDTLAFDEQRRVLVAERPEVMLLPANGRVAERLGTPPNMSLEEAVALAREVGTRLLIPHHYDMFAFNSRPEDDVARVLSGSGLPYLIAPLGTPVALSAMV